MAFGVWERMMRLYGRLAFHNRFRLSLAFHGGFRLASSSRACPYTPLVFSRGVTHQGRIAECATLLPCVYVCCFM